MSTPTIKEVLQLFSKDLGLTDEQIACLKVTEINVSRIVISIPCLPGGFTEFEGIRARFTRKFGTPTEGSFRSVATSRTVKEYFWKTSDGHIYLVADIGRQQGASIFEFARIEITNNGH